MKSLKQTVFAVLMALFLSACGGGGGGGGGSSTTTDLGGGGSTGGGTTGGGGGTTGTSSIVTAANAPAITAEVIAATDAVQDLGDGSASTFVGVEFLASNQSFSFADFARWQIKKFSDFQIPALASGIVGIQFGPETEPCDSGTVTLSGDVADPAGDLASGDVITLTFNNCSFADIGVTFTFNGTVSVLFSTVTGDPLSSPFNVVAQFSLINFQVSDGFESFSGNGAFVFSLATPDGVVFNGSITGDSISVSGAGFSSTLANFAFMLSENDATGAYTVTMSGSVASSELPSQFSYITTLPFQGVGGNYPFAGVLNITAADNSSITMTVIDSVNIQLTVDVNGDGVTDETINTTWAALESVLP